MVMKAETQRYREYRDPPTYDSELVYGTAYFGPHLLCGPTIDLELFSAMVPPSLCHIFPCGPRIKWQSVVDGIVFVLDSIEGYGSAVHCIGEEIVRSGLPTITLVNKVDRLVTELTLNATDCHAHLARVIDQVSVLGLPSNPISTPDFPHSSIVFGCARNGWGFTIETFAGFYATKFGVDADKLAPKLWGDNYYNPTTKTWTTSPRCRTTGKNLLSGFAQFIMEPIIKLTNAILTSDEALYKKMFASLNIKPDLHATGKALLSTAFVLWLPLHTVLLGQINKQIPSVLDAQQKNARRFAQLFPGHDEQQVIEAIQKGSLLLCRYW